MRSNQNKAKRDWNKNYKIRKNLLKMRFKIIKQIAKDIIDLPNEVGLQYHLLYAKVSYGLSTEEVSVLSKYIQQEFKQENNK